MRGGVERILVRAFAKRGMTETGSGESCEGPLQTPGFVQVLSPSDMVVVDGKEGEKRERLSGCVQVFAWGILNSQHDPIPGPANDSPTFPRPLIRCQSINEIKN